MEDSFDVERDGAEVMAKMERATRTHAPGALREALEHAAAFLFLAREQMPAGAHEPPIVVQVAARARTLKYAAA